MIVSVLLGCYVGIVGVNSYRKHLKVIKVIFERGHVCVWIHVEARDPFRILFFQSHSRHILKQDLIWDTGQDSHSLMMLNRLTGKSQPQRSTSLHFPTAVMISTCHHIQILEHRFYKTRCPYTRTNEIWIDALQLAFLSCCLLNIHFPRYFFSLVTIFLKLYISSFVTLMS